MTNTTTGSPEAPAAVSSDASAITAPTKFIDTRLETYAYRRFGGGAAPPLVCLQHFTGTLDNWDPAVTDALAQSREVILFESASGVLTRCSEWVTSYSVPGPISSGNLTPGSAFGTTCSLGLASGGIASARCASQ